MKTNATKSWRNWLAWTGLLLGVLVFGMGLRLWHLGEQSLWHDEIITARVSEQDVSSILRFNREQAGNPPLYFLATHFSFAWLGHGEFTARLPAALFGTASVLLTYALGQKLWTKRVGLIGAFLLGINAYHIQYSQEARPYSAMVFLTLLSLIFLVNALETNRVILWIGFALSTALGLYDHYFAFLILPGEVALGVWTLVEEWRPSSGEGASAQADSLSSARSTAVAKSVMFCASLVLIVASYVPWASTLVAQLPKQLSSGPVVISPAELQLSLRYLEQALVAYCGAGGVVLLLWEVVVLAGMARSARKWATLGALWMVTPFTFLSLIRSTHFFHPRYTLFILPLWILFATRGVCWGAQALERLAAQIGRSRGHQVPVIVVLATLLLAASSATPLAGQYEGTKGEWRETAQFLAAHMSPGDLVLADGAGYQYTDSTTVLRNLSYYMDRFGMTEIPILEVTPGLAESMSRDIPDTGGEVWAVLFHQDGLNTAGTEDTIIIVDFREAAVIRLREPSFDTDQDTLLMLHTLIKLVPASADFEIHLALAELCDAMGNRAEAAMHLELAAWTKPAHGSAWLLLANAYREHGRVQDAVAEYLGFLQTPSAAGERKWQRDAYFGLGLTYEQSGQPEQALAAYQQALNIDPAHWQSYAALGDLYLDLEDPAKSLAAYRQAVDLQPQNAWLYILLGEAYRRLGATEKAVEAYQESLGLDPSSDWARKRVEQFSQPVGESIPNPLRRSLGMELALLGYDVHSSNLEAGDTVNLSLWWQALAKMDRDYTAFIHLIGTDGSVSAQEDSLIVLGDQPTSTWEVGQVVREEYRLRLPSDAVTGSYTINVGAYYWETGERLAVWDEDGDRPPNDTIQLASILVSE